MNLNFVALMSVMTFGSISINLQAQENLTKIVKKPNIIFILADDLGYGDISCNNPYAKFNTPNIDKIAKAGMNFTHFYSNQSVCAPARCSIMTGKHQGHCSIRANQEVNPEGQASMTETITLATLLQDQGYKTGCIGKWGLGAPGTAGDPNNRGFDLFFGINCQRISHFYYPTYIWKNDQKIMLNGNIPNKGGPYYFPQLCKEEAVKFINENKDNPFFIWYTTPIPHASLQAPESYIKPFIGKFDEKPHRGSNHYVNTETPRAAFAGMVTHLDDEVGAMVEALKKNGLYENTIIIFASDNGPSSEGGHDPSYFGGAAPQTSGRKTMLNEGGIRVPFMISWPNRINNGVNHDMYVFSDVLPTLVKAAGGQQLPKDIDGISMLPMLTQTGEKQQKHEYLYWEFPAFGGQAAVRMGKWKALAKQIDKQGVQICLYDLSQDPLEKKDVAAQNKKIVGKVIEIMKTEHRLATYPNFRMKNYEDFLKETETLD